MFFPAMREGNHCWISTSTSFRSRHWLHRTLFALKETMVELKNAKPASEMPQ
jgi:hypothetical protein